MLVPRPIVVSLVGGIVVAQSRRSKLGEELSDACWSAGRGRFAHRLRVEVSRGSTLGGQRHELAGAWRWTAGPCLLAVVVVVGGRVGATCYVWSLCRQVEQS